MRPASWTLHAPDQTGGPRFERSGPAWTIGTDQLPPVLATLREALRWFRTVWRYEAATGHVFGYAAGLATRRAGDRIEIHAARWSAWADHTTALPLTYTDLPLLRQRLQQQHAVHRRKAAHAT